MPRSDQQNAMDCTGVGENWVRAHFGIFPYYDNQSDNPFFSPIDDLRVLECTCAMYSHGQGGKLLSFHRVSGPKSRCLLLGPV